MRRCSRVTAFALFVALLMSAGVTSAGAAAPGSLPQTKVEPSFGLALTTQMKQLWRAIESNSPTLGASIFFPRGAYLRMKTGTIADPSSDYTDRLVAFYNLDLAAYRNRVNAHGPATFVRVLVNAGVRLVFRHASSVQSVAVASLISWRGVWYVVHLGPNPRPTNVGTVDGFTNGPGVPGPAGGC